MEDINLLKQENEKLNARLKKAVEVFKEQKANIENLTKENAELKDQINRTPQEEVISTEKWNALVTEKENLQKQIEGYENERKSNEAYSDDLSKQCDNYELKVQELEKNIESKDKAYKVLQDTYNKVFAENTKLKNELQDVSSNKAESDSIAIASKEKIDELENEITNLKKTIDINTEETKKIVNNYENKITRLEEDNIKLDENNKLLNNTIEKLNNDLLESNKMRDAYLEEVKDKKATIDKCDEEISRCDDEIKKLKEDIDKSKEIYNNLENQKLALENDLSKLENEHNQLKDKYLILENEKDAYSNSDDALKEIIDVINKYGYEASKEITPVKENVMKTRIGSDKEFGQNVGV